MNTNQQWNQGQMPTGGNPQMQPEKDSGRKGLIIAISIVSVLVLALGGFIAYKMFIEKKNGTEVASEASADSLKNTAVEKADTLSKSLAEGKDAYGKGGDMPGLPEAVVLGFEEGVKDVVFGFDAGYGYTYHFNRDGQLVSVEYYDHGDHGTLMMLNGRALECSGQDSGYGDDEPVEPESYHAVYEYRPLGDKTDVYITVDGEKAKKIASVYYDDENPDRIVSIVQQDQVTTFKYDNEGRAFNKSGFEVYPPLALFFSEQPTLPKKHKVRRTDGQGRPTLVDAYQDTQHYTITYFD